MVVQSLKLSKTILSLDDNIVTMRVHGKLARDLAVMI
jgi:hypothetical protein